MTGPHWHRAAVDDAGNIEAIDDAVNGSLDQTFGYDESGNRESRTHGASTQTLTYESGLTEPSLASYGRSSVSSTGTPPGSGGSGLYIDVSAGTAAPSTSVTAKLRNAPGGASDWLALAVVGSGATSYLNWRYVGSGVQNLDWTVTMPSTPGNYEFRLFYNNGYTLLATSPAVTVTSSGGGAIGPLSYGGGSNRLATHSGNTVTLDDAGNTTDDPTENLSFVYDDHNRMVEAYVGATLKASYVYNGQGQRVKKIEATGAQRTIVYHYGPGGELLGETIYNSGGAKIGERDYLWLDTLPLAQSERTFSGGSVTSSQFVYLHADQLNTPRLATNASGSVVWRWDSDAFGLGDADTDPDSDTNLVNVSLRFPGQYLDEETGLNYNYFRDYDAVTGRYIQSDPMGLDGGINTYEYALANPIRFADPTGQAAVAAAARAAPAVGVGLGAAVACALNPELCVAMVSEVCADLSEGLADLSEPDPFRQLNKPDLNEEKKLTPGEIKKLKGAGIDPEQLKGGRSTGRLDLFKDRKGNIIIKPKDGSGPGEPTGININNL